MNTFKWVVLGTAGVSLVIGLLLLELRRTHWRATGMPSRARLVTAWAVLALCPVCVLFLFFPDSTVDGEFGWGQATGAVAAYFVIGAFAVMWSLKGDDLDARENELNARTAEVERRQRDLVAMEEANAALTARKELSSGPVDVFTLTGRTDGRLGIVPGRVENIDFADVWVSSENTNMQMARFYDRSLSGTIRYLGARKDAGNRIVDDVVARELAAQRGKDWVVEPATVFVTSAGELARSNKVRHIVHVAAVAGQPGTGYEPVKNLAGCVTAALRAAEQLARDRDDVRSVCLPLLGAGTGGGPVLDIAQTVIDAAVDFLESHPNGPLTSIYIPALSSVEQAACRAAAGSDARLRPPVPTSRHELVPAA
jgi:O-acetyl-ADP-ribose deacetylase (regulator of RNase III)